MDSCFHGTVHWDKFSHVQLYFLSVNSYVPGSDDPAVDQDGWESVPHDVDESLERRGEDPLFQLETFGVGVFVGQKMDHGPLSLHIG